MTKTGQGVIPFVCHTPSLGFELAQVVLPGVDVERSKAQLFRMAIALRGYIPIQRKPVPGVPRVPTSEATRRTAHNSVS